MKTKNNSRVIANIRLAMMLNNDEKKKEAKTVKPRNLPNKGKRLSVIALIGTIALVGQSCTGALGGMGGDGHFSMYGDAEGIRAFSDTINGLVTTGKASPDIEDAYWKSVNTRNTLKLKVIKPTFKKGVK